MIGVHQQRIVLPSEVRMVEAEGASAGAPKRLAARVLRYNVLDDYRTMFGVGCFTESLAERLPRITWAHDWREPIGRWVDFADTEDQLDLIGELDDFEAVPRARQAYAQLRSGTIDQFSVGFVPLAGEDMDPKDVDGKEGVYRFTKCRLDEAALVLVGAVPGTELLAVRQSARPEGERERIIVRMACVPLDMAQSVATQLGLGQISYDEAVNALTDAAMDMPEAPAEGDGTGEGGIHVTINMSAEDAAAAAAAEAAAEAAAAEADAADAAAAQAAAEAQAAEDDAMLADAHSILAKFS
jgi:HK97 family phage prohead protease